MFNLKTKNMKRSVIFCVDDEKIVLNALKSELKNSFGDRFIIETAENALEALDSIDDLLASNYEIPLIISDYAMPVMKGDEFLIKTHEKTPLTLNILLTGQATVEGVTNSINDANLYHYIAKPWDTTNLMLTVDQALKSYSQQNQLEKQNSELRELSSTLEEKVKKRTQELEEMNQLLIDRQKEISEQNKELEKYRVHLEELVEIRTLELKQATKKAQESERLKSSFMANISHEIRTPMNGILGFMALLRDTEVEKDTQTEYLNIIENCSLQLMGIITDIVEISKLETQLVKPVLSVCKIQNIVDTIVAMFKENISSNSNIVIQNSCQVEDILCMTDSVKLNQIFTNLISNAVKNTDKGTIELGSSVSDDSSLMFYVRDTGVGISREFHDVIFDRFRQVDSTLTRNQGGTGLGLAITKGYIELLGGKIWLESELGKGSTFYFTIPYLPGFEINELNQKRIDDHTDYLVGKTILVAEDEEINFSFIKIILELKGINLIRAINGEEAVTICKNNDQIDLVLMDIKMPLLNGFEATRNILKFRGDLPIIAQTAYGFSDDRQKALECGCVDYISKPIKSSILYEMLNKHLAKQ
jgi:two-component system, sensor histidine kinase and response regulator